MPSGFDFWNGTGKWGVNLANWSQKSPPTGVAEIQTGTVILITPASLDELLRVDAPATLQISSVGGELSTDQLLNAGSIDISGGQLVAYIVNNVGSISISEGRLSIEGTDGATGTLNGAGSITLKSGGTLSIDSSASGGTVDFAPGANAELLLLRDKGFGETISGLEVGAGGAKTDFIHISGAVTISSVSGQGTTDGTVTLSDGAVLHLTNISSPNWFVTATNDAGTDIYLSDIACYCRGTRILTDKGEVAVEDLAIGDAVVTASGQARPIKWIGRRSYGGRFIMGRNDILPICFKAGSLGDTMPRRDFWISPHHAMYFENEGNGGVLIEAKDLVNGISIVQAEQVESVEYFHVELDTHDVIVAEGALSETFVDDDSRGMFYNAHEYRVLYPDVAVRPAQYCAPRCSEGYEVEAVRAEIDKRGGLRLSRENPRGLRGYVDAVTTRRIAGWAQNPDYPEAPVCLDIYADGRLIGQVLANAYREDLEQAGVGSGRHGFEFAPPRGLRMSPGTIEVRRSIDGAVLEPSRKATNPQVSSRVEARHRFSAIG
jgi:hypothetical protein